LKNPRSRTILLAIVIIGVTIAGWFSMGQASTLSANLGQTVAPSQRAYNLSEYYAYALWASLDKGDYKTAKPLIIKLPDEVRSLLAAICPKSNGGSADCDRVAGEKAELAKAASDYWASTSAFDFQALSAVSMFQSGKTARAEALVKGPVAAAYQQQKIDGLKVPDALTRYVVATYAHLHTIRVTSFVILAVGIVAVLVIVAVFGRADPRDDDA
jgi:hypothetical protein